MNNIIISYIKTHYDKVVALTMFLILILCFATEISDYKKILADNRRIEELHTKSRTRVPLINPLKPLRLKMVSDSEIHNIRNEKWKMIRHSVGVPANKRYSLPIQVKDHIEYYGEGSLVDPPIYKFIEKYILPYGLDKHPINGEFVAPPPIDPIDFPTMNGGNQPPEEESNVDNATSLEMKRGYRYNSLKITFAGYRFSAVKDKTSYVIFIRQSIGGKKGKVIHSLRLGDTLLDTAKYYTLSDLRDPSVYPEEKHVRLIIRDTNRMAYSLFQDKPHSFPIFFPHFKYKGPTPLKQGDFFVLQGMNEEDKPYQVVTIGKDKTKLAYKNRNGEAKTLFIYPKNSKTPDKEKN